MFQSIRLRLQQWLFKSTMLLAESIVEDAALEWCGEQSLCARTLTRHRPRGEEKDREAIRRLNQAIPDEVRAVIKRYLRARFERRINP